MVSGYYNITGHCEEKKVKVVKVGKCDSKGLCKVKLSDGTFDMKPLPMRGEEVKKYICNKE